MKDNAKEQPAVKESQCENDSKSKLSDGILVSNRLCNESTVCEVVMKVSKVRGLNDVLAMNDH